MKNFNNGFISKIINFLKKVFGKQEPLLLVEKSEDIKENKETEIINDSNEEKKLKTIKEKEEQKEIVFFLYNNLKEGKLKPEYIPDKYLMMIKELFEEENRINQIQIDKLKNKISQLNTRISQL